MSLSLHGHAHIQDMTSALCSLAGVAYLHFQGIDTALKPLQCQQSKLVHNPLVVIKQPNSQSRRQALIEHGVSGHKSAIERQPKREAHSY